MIKENAVIFPNERLWRVEHPVQRSTPFAQNVARDRRFNSRALVKYLAAVSHLKKQ